MAVSGLTMEGEGVCVCVCERERERERETVCLLLSRDGATQEAGSCVKDFRNKPNPVKLRIIYLRGVLEVGHVTCHVTCTKTTLCADCSSCGCTMG